LNNNFKHGNAFQKNIKLENRVGQLQLHINDNGIGFNGDYLLVKKFGMGLQNIQKWAGIIGEEVAIKSNPSEGSNITIFVPYS
jgi:signal transduction histidine kinase